MWKGLESLKILSLVDNYLTSLNSGAFQPFKALNKIYLFPNGLKTFANGTWQGLESLEKIVISNNLLFDLREEMWEGAERVKELDLRVNRIEKIPSRAFSQSENLEKLYLSRNIISVLNQDAFEGIEFGAHHPVEILLDSNLLVCDDRMCWLKEAENQGWVKVWEYYEYEPWCVNLENTLWSEVELEY